jgi:hypothetical protein
MKTVKIIANIIIALIVLVPLLMFAFWIFVALLAFILLLAIVVKLSGGRVNININSIEKPISPKY